MCRRLVQDLNAVAVESHRVPSSRVDFRRPQRERLARRRRLAHPRQDVLMREDAGSTVVGDYVCANGGIPDGTGQDGDPRLGEFLIPAHVVGIGARVDDVANGQTGQPFDRRQNLVRRLRGPGVHQNDAYWSYLHGDVAARTRQHIEVGPDLHHVQIVAARPRLLRADS